MNDLLLQVIAVAVVANVALIVAAVIVQRLRRSGRPVPSPAAPAPGSPVAMAVTRPPEAASADRGQNRVAADHDLEGEAANAMEPDETQRTRRFAMPSDDDYPTTESVEAFLSAGRREPEPGTEPEPTVLIDEETGLESSLAWELALSREGARLARYGRPVTIVVAELDRLDALAARLGQETADRLIPPVAKTLRRYARAADLVARTGRTRFQILMPETDEIRAINYVERVREACDMWLEASAVSVRLTVGWASVGAGGSLGDALRLAEQRMYADRARGQGSRANVVRPSPTSGEPPSGGQVRPGGPGPAASADQGPVAPPAEGPATPPAAPRPPQVTHDPGAPGPYQPRPSTGPTV